MELSFLIVVGFIIWYIIASTIYRKTNYYAVTHKSFLAVRFDTGALGEYLTYKYLRFYERDGARFLYNCYLPKENGETTEIDVIMIHYSGIYVFESKNYSGWIFGTENSKTWTQTLPSGRRSHKEYFLNPIMQNKLHIKWLINQVGEQIPFHSVIVFSERCTLKKIDVTSTDIYVINRDSVAHTVVNIESRAGIYLSKSQVDSLYEKLYPYTQVTEEVKSKHVQNINSNHVKNVKTSNENNIKSQLFDNNLTQMCPRIFDESKSTLQNCPKCGGKILLKNAERGKYAGKQFYGCSNFPKCRFIKNI